MQFTHDQQLAINTEGCDILVSAAAGSGKTAVLTRRVLNKITDTSKNTDITDFLVVTFTISAAADLKSKLSDGIREEMTKEGADVSRLRRQLLSLSYAKIATIDSFCLFIVRDCLAELGLPVGISIGDSGEMDALALELMEETVEKFYSLASDDNHFLLLAETFSDARGDSQLIPRLLQIYNHLISFPRPMELLDEAINEISRVFDLRSDKTIFDSPVFAPIQQDITEKLFQAEEFYRQALDSCHGDGDAETKYAPLFVDELKFVEALGISVGESYEKFRELIESYTTARLPAVRGRTEDELLVKIKNLRQCAKDIVSGLKKEYLVKTEDELYMQTEIHLKILNSLNEVIRDFHTRYMEEKKARRIMSFSDAAHYAFSALIEKYDRHSGEFVKTPYAETLTDRFSEILIDEYQDVNELQDLIFRAISNGHNRFMVGDIKQSIYAFRGATPKIFEEYRDTFKPHTDENDISDEAKTVFLQNNYRSDSKIIDFVNAIFSRAMNWSEEKYLVKDSLVHSASDDRALPVELALFDSGSEDDICAEAEYIADTIAELVASGEYSLSDIAVLGRSAKILERVKASLDARFIPADTVGSSGFFESYEVLSLISLLRAVANPTDDVYLVSAMTTLPFSFTPDELYEIRSLSHKTDFWIALTRAAEREDGLAVKCREFIDFLDRMRDFENENSCERTVWKITDETGLFAEVERLPDPDARRENLISLYSMAGAFCHGERKGLGAFCEYLDNLSKSENSKNDKKQIPGAVRIMTFHGSKGLQFPVCFVAGLGQLMNKRDSFDKTVFSSYGPTFDLPYSEACTHLTSYLKKSATAEVKKALIDEELRTLYVALTRAKKLMYVTGEISQKALDSVLFASSLGRSSFAYTVKHAPTHMTFVVASLEGNPTFMNAVTGEGSVCREEGEMLNVTFFREYLPDAISMEKTAEKTGYTAEFTAEDIALAVSEINVSRAHEIPFKVSVSDIKEGLLGEDDDDVRVEFVSSPDFLIPEKKPSPAFIGTSMHTFMQFCSFDISGEEECRREAERLVREGFILPEHFECLDFVKLARIFESKLLADVRRSPLVEREKRYTLILPASRFVSDADTTDDKVLIQGVIDCYFENDGGGITLVDFKTDRVSRENGERILVERHSEQLKLYAQALSEILKKKVDRIFIYSFALDCEIEITN